jgi:ankyrin repeat protein
MRSHTLRCLSRALLLGILPALLRAQNINDPCSMLQNQFAIAAYNGDDATIAGMLRAGCDPNTPDPESHLAPLIFAIDNQHIRAALLLVQGNAQVNTWSGDWSALALAVNRARQASDDHDWLQLIVAMLDHGAAVDPVTADGWTPLLIACQAPRHTQLISLLLAHHADPNHATNKGMAPLEDALVHQFDMDKSVPIQAVQLLLASGASPDPPHPLVESPVEFAVNSSSATPQSAELLAMLLAAHADPNRVFNEDHDTPLSMALSNPNPSLAPLLVHYGASMKSYALFIGSRYPVLYSACDTSGNRIREMAALGGDFTWQPQDGDDGASNPVAAFPDCWNAPALAALVDLGIDLGPGLYAATTWGVDEGLQALIDAGAERFTASLYTDADPLRDGYLLRLAAEKSENPADVFPVLLTYGVDPLELGGDDRKGPDALAILDKRYANDKSDPDYLRARALLVHAMKQRLITTGFLDSAQKRLVSDRQRPGALQADRILLFRAALERYAADPDSIELRIFLAFLADGMGGLPPTPESAELVGQAEAAYARAHSRGDLLPVAATYEHASRLSPWVSQYYLDLVRLYLLTGSYNRAIHFAAMGYNAGLDKHGAIRNIFIDYSNRKAQSKP